MEGAGLAIGSNLGFSVLPKDTSRGIKPPALQSMDTRFTSYATTIDIATYSYIYHDILSISPTPYFNRVNYIPKRRDFKVIFVVLFLAHVLVAVRAEKEVS